MGPDLTRFMDLPYVYALVKLDGADTYMAHGVRPRGRPTGEIKTGTRIKAVFIEERKGTIANFSRGLFGSKC